MIDSQQYDPHTPTTIDDIVGNYDVIQETAKLIQMNKASHIILVGPQGCGKSLFLRIVLRGKPLLVIDCTANSGLRSVRDSIRNFARGSKTADGQLRWIVFEHAEALTADTQAFLRRMLETTSNSTRIVFECKDTGAISEPIVSRSSIVSFNAPELTDMVFELQRRTDYKVPKDISEKIAKYSYGNMRAAMINILAYKYCPNQINYGFSYTLIESLIAKTPKNKDSAAWVQWSIQTEMACRDAGIDLRDILRQGWPKNPIVANICAQWSRLGGTSPRTLFFDCISALLK